MNPIQLLGKANGEKGSQSRLMPSLLQVAHANEVSTRENTPPLEPKPGSPTHEF